MTEREKLQEKLRKLKALAEQGVGGEKENAEKLLAALMKKHNISEEEIEEVQIKTYFIRYKTEWERRLLHQLAYMHLGSGHSSGCVGTYTGHMRKKVSIKCTAAVYLEIEAEFDIYRRALEKEIEYFYYAFVSKNNLYPPPELADDSLADGDIKKAMKIASYSSGIDKVERYKRLEAHE